MVQDNGGAPKRFHGHQAACAMDARRWSEEGRIAWWSEGFAGSLMASRADLALRDVVAVCCGSDDVPGYRLPASCDPSCRARRIDRDAAAGVGCAG